MDKMHNFMLGVIGAGNMGSAILQGALDSGIMSPEQVWIANPHVEKLTPFGDRGVTTTVSNLELAKAVDILLLAVKPQRISEVIEEVRPYTAGKCVVSIAAGISRAWLQAQLPGAHIICVMPNTPLMLGCGASAMTERGNVPEEVYQCVYEIFTAVGLVKILPADKINEIIPVSGSSPAFFFRMISLMVQAAEKQGIDPDTALAMASKTMEGAALMLQNSGKTAEELEKQVCSPGGTTLAGLTAFDDLGFDRMIDEAFTRCTKRAYELGK